MGIFKTVSGKMLKERIVIRSDLGHHISRYIKSFIWYMNLTFGKNLIRMDLIFFIDPKALKGYSMIHRPKFDHGIQVLLGVIPDHNSIIFTSRDIFFKDYTL